VDHRILFGFIGLGIDWTTPDDLILLIGVSIPVVNVFTVLATGQTIIKTGFPIIAVAALIKIGSTTSN
jgi:membrane protein implicated in regulation of membrane protease activity